MWKKLTQFFFLLACQVVKPKVKEIYAGVTSPKKIKNKEEESVLMITQSIMKEKGREGCVCSCMHKVEASVAKFNIL